MGGAGGAGAPAGVGAANAAAPAATTAAAASASGPGGHPLGYTPGPKTKDPAYYDMDIDLTVYDWFHGKMSSNDAYQLLATQPKGAYVLVNLPSPVTPIC